jgi:hypothetical protein
MPAPDGKRTSLASYTWGGWGSQNDVTRFRDIFQPDGGSFSPSYPLVPPEREQVRLWDYPVGYNAIYTPRSYEAIGFNELRALAESHDITRLAIETRKDQVEKLDWTIKSRNEKTPDKDAASRIDQLTEFWRSPDGEKPFATCFAKRSKMSLCSTRRHLNYDVTAAAKSSGSTSSTAPRSKYCSTIPVGGHGHRPRPTNRSFTGDRGVF